MENTNSVGLIENIPSESKLNGVCRDKNIVVIEKI